MDLNDFTMAGVFNQTGSLPRYSKRTLPGRGMKKISIYICDHCGEEFRSKRVCAAHEKNCDIGNCYQCKHAYWAYGCEFNCELLNNGKKCNFEERKEKK